METARDTYKWLLILALKDLPGHTLNVSSAELKTHLAGKLFDVEIRAMPGGGAHISLRYAVEKDDAFAVDPMTPEEEAEVWSSNRVVVLTEKGEVVIGDLTQ